MCPNDGTTLVTTSSIGRSGVRDHSDRTRRCARHTFRRRISRSIRTMTAPTRSSGASERPLPHRRRIGRGGMGTVYLAEHPSAERFAVRCCCPGRQALDGGRAAPPGRRGEPHRHENIVSVVLRPHRRGRVFIVMELLRGESLDAGRYWPDRARSRDPPSRYRSVARSARRMRPDRPRDLKPENVFLVKKGDFDFVKVLDFHSKVKSALRAAGANMVSCAIAVAERVGRRPVSTYR